MKGTIRRSARRSGHRVGGYAQVRRLIGSRDVAQAQAIIAAGQAVWR
jgi:hypothetical protein